MSIYEAGLMGLRLGSDGKLLSEAFWVGAVYTLMTRTMPLNRNGFSIHHNEFGLVFSLSLSQRLRSYCPIEPIC